MDQHGGRIALLPSQPAMFDGGRGRNGIAVLIGQLGCVQTYYQIINQLRKMSGTFLIAKMKMVELRRLLRSCQPILYQGSLAASQDCGHALPPRNLRFIGRNRSHMCDWLWSSHLAPPFL